VLLQYFSLFKETHVKLQLLKQVKIVECFPNPSFEEPISFQGNLDCIDTNARMAFHNAAANEWLGFRLEMIGATVLCTSALFLVILPENVIKPGSLLYT
jgi:hypothetical protein